MWVRDWGQTGTDTLLMMGSILNKYHSSGFANDR